jgi:tetratricopeptide (TPR) repeat protein
LARKIKSRLIKYTILCICLSFSACNDFSCKGLTCGPSLRNYTASDRIEKINNEISNLLKNEKDTKVRLRLGDLNEQLATIYIDKEDLDNALFHIDSAFKYGRNTPYLNYLAGLVYGNRGAKTGSKDEVDKAEKYYRQAVSLKKDYIDAWYSLAVLLFLYKNERDEPIKILEKIYTQSRSNYRVRFALGRFYYESDRKEDALEIYKTLQVDLEKLPDSPMTREYLSNCRENIQRIMAEI